MSGALSNPNPIVYSPQGRKVNPNALKPDPNLVNNSGIDESDVFGKFA